MKRAFSLIEVVVALAMLALIAVPAIGLATMAARRNQKIMTTGDASELKRRVDAAIRAYGAPLFTWDLSDSENSKNFFATKDLYYIEETEAVLPGGVAFYEINLRDPVNYSFTNGTDSYRIVMYEVLWLPEGSNEQTQLFFTSVFRK